MSEPARVAKIRAALARAFAPSHLEIVDESHLHAGHAGAATGRGHFRVSLVSTAFAGVLPVQRHRMVYAALGSLMESDIHALSIAARTAEETAPS